MSSDVSPDAGSALDPRPTRLLRVYPLNEQFGTGAFRRRVRLSHRSGMVTAILDDNNHAMWVRLAHDGSVVSAIEGGFERWPTTGCLGASAKLAALIGTSIDASREMLFADGRARSQCTHLYDLASLALAMALRSEGDRIWDAVVPDARDGKTVARIELNGTAVHIWPLEGDLVTLDGKASQSLLSGFMPWAEANFSGDGLEGAAVLRMTAFTARARAHITDDNAWPLTTFPERAGVCHAYSEPQVEAAKHRCDVVKDFSWGIMESKPPFLRDHDDPPL